jgi:hypothetical protein
MSTESRTGNAAQQQEVHVGSVMHRASLGKTEHALDEVIRIIRTRTSDFVVTGPDEEALGTISQMDLPRSMKGPQVTQR